MFPSKIYVICHLCYIFSWVPVVKQKGNASTPPPNSATSSNAGDSGRRHSPEDAVKRSSGHMASSTDDNNGEEHNKRHSRQHNSHGSYHTNAQRRSSPKRVSLLRHDPGSGVTDTVILDNHAVPNGDSGEYYKLYILAFGIDMPVYNRNVRVSDISCHTSRYETG
jgi:hypothetical protein